MTELLTEQVQVLLCLSYAQSGFRDWEGLPRNPSICNGHKGLIGLVVQLAILLQIFGGRRGDDVLRMSYMHAKLERQPTDQEDHVNSVGPSPATLIKFTMLMNKVSNTILHSQSANLPKLSCMHCHQLLCCFFAQSKHISGLGQSMHLHWQSASLPQ